MKYRAILCLRVIFVLLAFAAASAVSTHAQSNSPIQSWHLRNRSEDEAALARPKMAMLQPQNVLDAVVEIRAWAPSGVEGSLIYKGTVRKLLSKTPNKRSSDATRRSRKAAWQMIKKNRRILLRITLYELSTQFAYPHDVLHFSVKNTPEQMIASFALHFAASLTEGILRVTGLDNPLTPSDWLSGRYPSIKITFQQK